MISPKQTVPDDIPEGTPFVGLLRTSVREKRAYYVKGAFRLFWFDDWAASKPFTPCGILSKEEVAALHSWPEKRRIAYGIFERLKDFALSIKQSYDRLIVRQNLSDIEQALTDAPRTLSPFARLALVERATVLKEKLVSIEGAILRRRGK